MLNSPPIQDIDEVKQRRMTFMLYNLLTWAFLLICAWNVFGAQGWSWVDIIFMICFTFGTPWAVLGFWNAVIGLWFLHFSPEGLHAVAPYVKSGERNIPISIKTAILMTLRNEDPKRALSRLKIVHDSVVKTGFRAQYSFFVLSDSNDYNIYSKEQEICDFYKTMGMDITYRRRSDNTGYKAGNLRDFCAQWGNDYELMLPLDADSVMDGDTIVKMTRICQTYDNIGILQGLVVGSPSQSAFARMFQFGMRHGMRSYTMGQAWWACDCGPFWGHNAMVRIKPFYEKCALPLLAGSPPLGGHILSHDQVEAAFMRKAGFECRIYPIESGSYEENPPSLIPYMARDTRWCQGNLQYLQLLDTKLLLKVSRFQLIWAILMFIGVPAWTVMLGLLPIKLIDGETHAGFPAGLAIFTYLLYLIMYLMPKIAGVLDIIMTDGGVDQYGGAGKFWKSVFTELAFSFLVGAASTFRITQFMIGLLMGKSITWSGQQRDAESLSWGDAAYHLKGQTIFGLYIILPLAIFAPAVFWWSLPLTLGFLVAIPLAVFTASPKVGAWFVKEGLCGIPEDFNPPSIIQEVQKL